MRSSLIQHKQLALVITLALAGCVTPVDLDEGEIEAADKEFGEKAVDLIDVYVYSPMGQPDWSTSSLQAALDYVAQAGLVQQTAWIQMKPGLYRHDNSCLTVSQADWRESCTPLAARTAFLLKGRQAPTYITGTTGNPRDVIIWGKIPDDVAQNQAQAFHGLTLDSNTGVVEIANVSIVADGGWIGNGVADASLAVVNSRVDLVNAIVLGNKKSSNCLQNNVNADQEGILAYGTGTDLRVYDSAVGGNLHTGVMVVGGAKVLVQDSLVRGNGWVSQFSEKGHGITEFHNSSKAACLNSNNEIDVYNSIILFNSGDGVYVRGNFNGRTQTIDKNSITDNSRYGFRVDGGSWSGAPSTTTFTNSHVYLTNNTLVSNQDGDISIYWPEIVGTNWYHSWGGNTQVGDGPDDSNIWNKLIAVHDYMATIARSCPVPQNPVCP